MKLLTTAIICAMMTGCVAHAHTPPPPGYHAQVTTVKAWVWVNGHWRNGHWVRGHWTVRHVKPHLINRNPQRYIKYHQHTRRPTHPPPPRHRRR